MATTPEDKPESPTTFRDDPAPQRCPYCGAPAVALAAGEAKCKAGHTWKAGDRGERTVRARS